MYLETLYPGTKILLDKISIPNEFYLAGGTALALQLGHRQSVDLDFFTENDFNPQNILNVLQSTHTIQNIQIIQNDTLYLNCDNVKVSFIKYLYSLIGTLLDYNQTVKLASIEDILCMKLSAISSRNTKKDFIDIYYILKLRNYSLDFAIELLRKKYQNFNLIHIIYSLTYFEEADTDPDVIWQEGFQVSWESIKNFFIDLAEQYTRSNLQETQTV
jgi:predicted nucleotidyltransferase component of viral defense system